MANGQPPQSMLNVISSSSGSVAVIVCTTVPLVVVSDVTSIVAKNSK